MRKLGNLATEGEAQRFAAYLTVNSMPAQADKGRDGSWEIWVVDDKHLEAARNEFDTFLQNPADARYAESERAAEKARKKEAADQKRSRMRIIDARSHFGVFHNTAPGPFAVALIFACVGLYALGYINPEAEAGLQRLLLMSPEGAATGEFLPEVERGQVWRLFTPALLHGGFFHLLFNMMWVRQLGSTIEHIEGSWRFSLQVLVYALAGNLLQYFWKGPSFLGMSGVTYGLFGFIWICSKYDPARAYVLEKETVVFALIWFFLCFTGWVGPIANVAHAGCFLAGILVATLTVRQVPFTRIRF